MRWEQPHDISILKTNYSNAIEIIRVNKQANKNQQHIILIAPYQTISHTHTIHKPRKKDAAVNLIEKNLSDIGIKVASRIKG